jgi:hypothetical protein
MWIYTTGFLQVLEVALHGSVLFAAVIMALA